MAPMQHRSAQVGGTTPAGFFPRDTARKRTNVRGSNGTPGWAWSGPGIERRGAAGKLARLMLFAAMLTDLRHSVRVVLLNPLVASVAILSLALGIGGAASVFTVLNAIVLRDLPLSNPQQLYVAEKQLAAGVSPRYSWPFIQHAEQELKDRAELFAATTPTQMQVRLATGSDGAERSNVQLVSGGFFTALRQRPIVGRLIEPATLPPSARIP